MGQLKSPDVGLREQLIVVVHQVRSPDNLGAIARLMANFGLPRLVLSEPVTYKFDEARKMGVRGGRLLDSMEIMPSLPQSLADAVYAVGTTSRELEGRTSLTPEAAVEKLAVQSARGEVALVLGGEKRGLSDEDLSHCQDYLIIPTEPEQPSMNLAQATAVLTYLCARADQKPRPPVDRPPGARLRTVQVLEATMRELLLDADFLNAQAPEPILKELERSLLRAELSQREAELWVAAFKQLKRSVAASRGAKGA